MSERDSTPTGDDPLTVAEVLGERYPSPDQLAAVHGEDELRSTLVQLAHQEAELDHEIALQSSNRKRVRAERLITEQALRIIADKGLE